MMKILLIFALYLISGPADCSDVIGYSGGSVIITSNIQWYSHDSKYICKMKENDCTDIIRADTKRRQVQDGRFMVYSNSAKNFLVLIRKLKPQDAGTYRFGLGNQSNSTVNLKVYNNTSCGVPKIMNAYLGQNITINCNYPREYERNTKYLDSVDDDSNIKNILDNKNTFQNDRFSMSDDRSAKVLSVNISNVREADGVFYLFGMWNGAGSVGYYTYFIEMWLHVTGLSTTIQPTTTAKTTESYVITLAALTETSSAVCFSPAVTISVCVCAALLLIGGLGLMIYKLMHKKKQNYTASFMTEQDKPVNSYSNTDSANLYENFRTSPI